MPSQRHHEEVSGERHLTLVGGNEFNRIGDEVVLPEMFFNWLLRLSPLAKPLTNLVTDQEASLLADAIADVPRDDEQAIMLGLLGDPNCEAMKAFIEFLREGGFTIR